MTSERGGIKAPDGHDPAGDEWHRLTGPPEQWVADPEFRFASPLGMEVVVVFEGAEADVVRRAARALDVDYVDFAHQAVLDAARGIVARDTPTDEWLTIAAAAERFGVKRDRLQRAAMEGRLPARKAGEGKSHPWLVRPADVERYLRESRRSPRLGREVA